MLIAQPLKTGFLILSQSVIFCISLPNTKWRVKGCSAIKVESGGITVVFPAFFRNISQDIQ